MSPYFAHIDSGASSPVPTTPTNSSPNLYSELVVTPPSSPSSYIAESATFPALPEGGSSSPPYLDLYSLLTMIQNPKQGKIRLKIYPQAEHILLQK